MFEKAQSKRGNAPRKILVRGKPIDSRLNSDPLAIARSMRKESPSARREARLQELERKHGLR